MNIPAPFSQNQTRFFWNCFDHWLNVAEGGKRGGKNVLITMAYCTIPAASTSSRACPQPPRGSTFWTATASA